MIRIVNATGPGQLELDRQRVVGVGTRREWGIFDGY